MATPKTLRSEFDEVLRLIKAQAIEIRRQRRQMELQFRRSADMQVQLDRLLAADGSPHALRTIAHPPTLHPPRRRSR